MAKRLQNVFNSKAYRHAVAVSVMALNAAITPHNTQAMPYVPREDKTYEAKALARPDHLYVEQPERETKVTILSPLSLPEIWANYGAPETVVQSLSRQSPAVQEKIAARTEELFSNNDFLTVLHQISTGKAQSIDKMLAGIANIPPEMDIITLAYTRVPSEQNHKVWDEFQAQSEPAFYRHLYANHKDALKAAGFCDYALSCLARGLSPTTEEGIPYNVDVDHIVERAGGGKMSTEPSVDPIAGGPPSYPINHIGNLCLILKQWHNCKNELNGAQNIAATQPGDTRMLCMAVPPLSQRGGTLLSAALVQPYLPPSGRDSVYFAQGTSLLLTNRMEEIAAQASLTPEIGREVFDLHFKNHFAHTVNVWTRVTEHVEKMAQDGTLPPKEAKDLQATMNDYLVPLIAASRKTHAPQEELEKLVHIGDRMQTVIVALQEAQKAGQPKKPQQQGQKAKG